MGTATTANGVGSGNVPQQPTYLTKFDLTMSASYATGGDDLDVTAILPAGTLPVGATVLHVFFEPDGVYHLKYDGTGKVLAFEGAAGVNVEVTATTNLSAVTVTGFVLSQ